MEALLDSVGIETYALVPREAAPFHQAMLRRHVGTPHASERDQFRASCVPAKWYDLLIYFREVQPSHLLDGVH